MKNHIYKRGRIWWWRYRPHGDCGKPICVSLQTSDKQVAQKKATELVAEKERERAGLIAPAIVRQAATKNLEFHVYDFQADLLRKGRKSKYVENLGVRINNLMTACGWSRVSDINADSFVAWRSQQQELSAKTINAYLDALVALLNWMMRVGRITANPLHLVDHIDTTGSETRKRRAFTDDELKRLLAAAGRTRKYVYLTAAFTGLRRGELEQLLWSDIHLDDTPTPFMKVRGSTTKNGKDATMRPPDL